jgi:hypothetical protein
MPPKTGGGGGGGGGGVKKRNHSVDNTRTQPNGGRGPVQGGKPLLAGKPSQPKFNVAPLILEGVKVNKLQMNDLLKQHLQDVKVNDIQLNRSGTFTLFANDVISFNRILNDFTAVLTANGHPGAKLYVPRSIQRIKDTDKVAFVKRVDLELPEDRMVDALKAVGLDVINVLRLNGKDGKTPTRTIKITFSDVQNRNTFVHTGLQVDSMHFTAEAASQNTKPVQCYICLKYGHIAKYCKTKQQVCARCGDNHRIDQCTVASDAGKCCNCKGNHLATSNDCSHYREQETKMLNLINQYTSTSKQITPTPAPYNKNEYPPLPNLLQQQKDILQSSFLEDILNALSSKMEAIIEETTNRIFKAMQQKIKKLEMSIGIKNNKNDDDELIISDSDSNEEGQVVRHIKNQQIQTTQKAKLTTNTTDTSANPTTTTTNITTSKQSKKQKEATKTTKRGRSPNSSLNSTTNDNKDLKTSNNDD